MPSELEFTNDKGFEGENEINPRLEEIKIKLQEVGIEESDIDNLLSGEYEMDKLPAAFRKIKGQISKEIVDNGFELINDPKDPNLKEFYNFLIEYFKPEEIEPFETFQKDLKNEKLPVRCIVMKDPKTNEIVCATWGNYMNLDGEENKSFLMGKFTVTKRGIYRYMNLATHITNKMINEMKDIVKEKGDDYLGRCGEATEMSEGFWNQWTRRIYIQNPDGSSKEIYYQIPPLKWNHKTGEPLNSGALEHLQIQSDNNTINPEKCLQYIKTIYKNWYFRPKEEFENDNAYQNHAKYIKDVLTKIENQFQEIHNELVFLSKVEREKSISDGKKIISQDINKKSFIS